MNVESSKLVGRARDEETAKSDKWSSIQVRNSDVLPRFNAGKNVQLIDKNAPNGGGSETHDFDLTEEFGIKLQVSAPR